MSRVHVVVPGGVDDSTRPSGGNVYDRRLCEGLRADGWQVREHAVAGSWPWPDSAARSALARAVAAVPDGEPVVVDGLLGSTVPDVLAPAAQRVALVALVHMPLGLASVGVDVARVRDGEREALQACRAVVVTSRWARARLLEAYSLPPGRTYVAEPGTDPVPPSCGTADGARLLCVAAVVRHKGHDLLLEALASVADVPWLLRCIGPLDRDPEFVIRVRQVVGTGGIADRVQFAGPLGVDAVQREYDDADALVLASRFESYGMVVTEALAHAMPVIATATGGIPEALGRTGDRRVPGLLVPTDNAEALAAAVRDWLTDSNLRRQLRRAAADRCQTLPRWSTTAQTVGRVIRQVAT